MTTESANGSNHQNYIQYSLRETLKELRTELALMHQRKSIGPALTLDEKQVTLSRGRYEQLCALASDQITYLLGEQYADEMMNTELDELRR